MQIILHLIFLRVVSSLCGCQIWLIRPFVRCIALLLLKLCLIPSSNTRIVKWAGGVWGDCESALLRKSWQISATAEREREQTRDGNRQTGWCIEKKCRWTRRGLHLLWSSPRCWDIPDKHKSVHACDSSVTGDWCGCRAERVKNRTDERKTAELCFLCPYFMTDHSVCWFMDRCSRPYRVCGKLFDKCHHFKHT